ncbi:hypothetical protein MPL3356_70186 [Mesorhizobium plurifarium]|uniref:Uncharacterized protein n=1 Tax=Mesorhizobium plurifarium TaxID=69974 RepID=A0A090EH90_MESPL|nr:hypothetical protein MPL3356_70186 [Mesorhizobium plurifarium]
MARRAAKTARRGGCPAFRPKVAPRGGYAEDGPAMRLVAPCPDTAPTENNFALFLGIALILPSPKLTRRAIDRCRTTYSSPTTTRISARSSVSRWKRPA